MDPGGLQRIFFCVVKEAGGELYFVHFSDNQAAISENSTAYLKAGDGFLYQHRIIVRKGQRDSCVQLGRSFDPGDAEGRAGLDRFDKQRIMQMLRHGELLCLCRHPPEKYRFRDFYAVQADQRMGQVLVHAQGGGFHAAACYRQAGQLTQALYGSVLAVLAVQYRKYRIQPDQFHSAGPHDQESMISTVRRKHRGTAVGGGPGILRNPVNIALIAEPGAFPGNTHEVRLIFFLI